MEKRNLTEDNRPRDVALVVVRQQHQLGDEDAVVEPDRQHHADAQPAHGVNHEVQAKLHGGTCDDIGRDLLLRVSSRLWNETPNTGLFVHCSAESLNPASLTSITDALRKYTYLDWTI